MAGTDASAVIDITYSKNNHIDKLAGGSVGAGVGMGYETNIPINSDAASSQTFSIGLYGRAVPIPVENHAYLSSTIIK